MRWNKFTLLSNWAANEIEVLYFTNFGKIIHDHSSAVAGERKKSAFIFGAIEKTLLKSDLIGFWSDSQHTNAANWVSIHFCENSSAQACKTAQSIGRRRTKERAPRTILWNVINVIEFASREWNRLFESAFQIFRNYFGGHSSGAFFRDSSKKIWLDAKSNWLKYLSHFGMRLHSFP